MNRSSLIHLHPNAFKELQEVCEVGLLFTKVMVSPPQHILFFIPFLFFFFFYYSF